MKYYFKYYLLVWLGCLISCNSGPATPAQVPANQLAYFNLSAFILQQVKQLEVTPVVVEKTVTTWPDAPETKILRTMDWAQELETFTQADINKPALRSAYEVTKATASDGQIKTMYRKQAGYRDAPVEYLEIITSPEQQVKQITGRFRENNYLVSNSKDFVLHCALVNDQNQVIAYRISGAQKTVFFAPLRYQVQGKIQ